jgi:broad specificity phosphatase PhoE
VTIEATMPATATTIMLIRHAEKPDADHQGVDQKGKPSDHDLIVRGWQRAGALAHFFNNPDPKTPLIKTPGAIFATEPANGSDSKRPVETVTPTEQLLKLTMNSTILENDITGLVKAAEAADDVVLIAWHHQKIPDIANAILQKTVVTKKWPSDRFDVVWVFNRSSPTAPWSFSQVPQMLLFGDSSSPIKTS